MAKHLLIFLDESGDLGFDFTKKKSSSFFVITILIAEDFFSIKSSVARTIKNKINHPKKKRLVKEFKGSDTTLEMKKYFFNLMDKQKDWFLHCVILDKKHLLKSSEITSTDKIYNLLAKIVLEEIETIDNASIIQLNIDKSKTSNEIKIFDKYISDHMKSKFHPDMRLNIEHLNSESNAGLQAADAFCYGVSRKYELGDMQWYEIFKERIKKEIIYRP